MLITQKGRKLHQYSTILQQQYFVPGTLFYVITKKSNDCPVEFEPRPNAYKEHNLLIVSYHTYVVLHDHRT